MQVNSIVDCVDLIRQSAYTKAYRVLDMLIVHPTQMKYSPQNLELQIQVLRRYLYVVTKLICRCLNNYANKSHRLQPLFDRAFNAIYNYYYYIIYYMDIVSPPSKRKSIHAYQRRYNVISTTINPILKELQRKKESTQTTKWLLFQIKSLENYTSQLTIYLYIYQRCQQIPDLSLYMIYTLSKFQFKQIDQFIQTQILIANSYFQVKQFHISYQYYQIAFELSSKQFKDQLDQFEKLQIEFNDPTFWKNIQKYVSLSILSLYLISLSQEYRNNYKNSLDSIDLACFLFKILEFIPSSIELGQLVEHKAVQLIKEFQTHIDLEADIHHLFKNIFTAEYQQLKPKEKPWTQYDIIQHEIYEKMNNQELEKNLIIVNKSKNKVQEKVSKQNSGSLHVKSKSQFDLSSTVYPSFVESHSQEQLHSSQFLTNLMRLSRPASIHSSTKKQKKQPRSDLKKFIQQSLQNKEPCLEYDEVLEKTNNLMNQQKEISNEMPKTALLLKSKKYISRSQIDENDISFKAKEYFHYKHDNLKESFFQEIPSEIKIAERKLLNSKNLIMKKQFSCSQIVDQTDQKQKKISNIDYESQKLLENVVQKNEWEGLILRQKRVSNIRQPQKKKLQNLNSKIFTQSEQKRINERECFKEAKTSVVNLLESHEKTNTRRKKSQSINVNEHRPQIPCDLARSIRYMQKKKLTIVGAARLRALISKN